MDAQLGAVVLTGGGAVRLDGLDKASLEIGGRSLLEHVLAALSEIPEIVVVGEELPTSRPVTFRREDPPGSGPAAGLIAGIAGFPKPPRQVVVLAVDMPLVNTATVRRLMLEAASDGARLLDEHGKKQHLCGVYRTAAVLGRVPSDGDLRGMSMKKLLKGLDIAGVPAVAREARDVDSWDDVRELRELLGEG